MPQKITCLGNPKQALFKGANAYEEQYSSLK